MIYGLIGEKLSHSYSPEIHRAFFDLTGRKGEYLLFELKQDELGAFLQKALREGYRGLNVTIPYKTAIIPHLRNLSPEAVKIGAVNTIRLCQEMSGYNTDYFGIKYTMIKNQITPKGKKALVLGSGGAARAVVTCLLDYGINRLFLASRRPSEISGKISGVTPLSYEEINAYRPFDLIVNTTPVGMYPKTGASPLTTEQMAGSGFLFDLIYNPVKTELIKKADSMGIPSVNGLYMLVAQAMKAQELWNCESYGLDMVDAVYEKITGQFV